MSASVGHTHARKQFSRTVLHVVCTCWDCESAWNPELKFFPKIDFSRNSLELSLYKTKAKRTNSQKALVFKRMKNQIKGNTRRLNK